MSAIVARTAAVDWRLPGVTCSPSTTLMSHMTPAMGEATLVFSSSFWATSRFFCCSSTFFWEVFTFDSAFETSRSMRKMSCWKEASSAAFVAACCSTSFSQEAFCALARSSAVRTSSTSFAWTYGPRSKASLRRVYERWFPSMSASYWPPFAWTAASAASALSRRLSDSCSLLDRAFFWFSSDVSASSSSAFALSRRTFARASSDSSLGFLSVNRSFPASTASPSWASIFVTVPATVAKRSTVFREMTRAGALALAVMVPERAFSVVTVRVPSSAAAPPVPPAGCWELR